MPAGRWHRAHLPTLWRYSLGFRATWQAVFGLPTGTGYSDGQRAGQAGAAVARGRALVIAAAQPSTTWQITWGAVAITAAAAALVAAACLRVAALLVAAEAFMAGQQLLGLPTSAALLQHGSAECGAGPLVAPLCTPVPPTGQQLVTCGPTWRSFFITCQPLVRHLSSTGLIIALLETPRRPPYCARRLPRLGPFTSIQLVHVIAMLTNAGQTVLNRTVLLLRT